LTHVLARFARHLLLAVQFFTRVPVTGALAGWVGFSPAMLRASAAHFPAVGWLAAAVAAGTYAAALLLLPPLPAAPLVAAVLCTVATVLLTGAFHEDGLSDLADGLGGSHDRTRALAIMKDSRIGAFGAIALVLALLAKVALLALLGQAGLGIALAALLAGHVLSRFWPLLVIATLRHVGEDDVSKSKPLAERIDTAALAAGMLWCLPPLALCGWLRGPAFVAAALLAGAAGLAWMHRLLRRRLQGFTGDGLGAVQQVTELATYLGIAVALGTA
jgi:adenosylcobinamide-GDP ribazoletransferase